MKTAIFVIALSALAGCATTPRDLETSGDHFAADVPAPPAVAYRELVTRLRDCFANKAFRIEADYFPDIDRARVTLGLTQATMTMATVRMERAPTGTTMYVSHYNPLRRASAENQWRSSLVEWANARAGMCMTDFTPPR